MVYGKGVLSMSVHVNETFYDKTFLTLWMEEWEREEEAILWLVAENSGSSRDARDLC